MYGLVALGDLSSERPEGAEKKPKQGYDRTGFFLKAANARFGVLWIFLAELEGRNILIWQQRKKIRTRKKSQMKMMV